MMIKHTQNLTLTALMAAVLCIVGPWVIPIGVVPISLTNMAVYLTIILLDKKSAMISVALYLLIGFVGLPVFSGFTGGAGKIFGPTGGYLAGYLVLCLMASCILEVTNCKILALATGTCGLYLFGTLWLMLQSKLPFMTALSAGVIPFVLFDLVKIMAAVTLGNAIKKRMQSLL